MKYTWMWGTLLAASLSLAACGSKGHQHHDEEEETHTHQHEEGHHHEEDEDADHDGHHHEEDEDADHDGHHHEEDEDADHDGHHHDADHDGHHHDDDHEGHHHDADHEGHHHDADHEGHSHEEGHAHAGSDEITISPAKAKAAGIRSQVVKPGPFAQVIEVSGRIEAAQGSQTTLVASTSGTVRFNQVLTQGSTVAAGAAVMTISTQQVAQADPYEQARITFESAEREYQRAQKLMDSQLINKTRFSEIKERYERARLELNAVSKHSRSGAQTVTSPMAGYVQQCLVQNGDYVEVGQPVAVVSANQRLYMRADVPERYYPVLGSIQSANVRLASGEVLRLADMDGKVVSRGQSATGSYYLPVTFSFESQGRTIPGSFVEVYLLCASRPQVLSVPLTALIEEQGLYFVFLQLDDECYRKQEVKLGARDGVRVEVLSGLKAQDKVVTEGAYQVKLASAATAIPGHSHHHH